MSEKIIISAIQPEFTPRQAHETDAGFDVFARAQTAIPPHSIANIPIGVKVAMPKGTVCLVFPRSSLPLKKGLMLSNSVGVVDSGYRGELHLQLYNLNNEPAEINWLEKIGQLVFVNYSSDVVVDNKYYDTFEEEYPSDRGVNGFGSTGS